MALIQTVTLGTRKIELHKFTGEVVDEKIWATTQVSGGGGGYNVGSGRNNPVTIASSTTTHNQFFLKDDAGQEKAFEIDDTSVALRKGHRVTVFWGIIEGQGQGLHVAIYNHTTKSSKTFPASIQSLATPGTPGLIQLAWIASIFGVCLYGLGIIGLIILTITRGKYKKELRATLQSAVDQALSASTS